MSGQDKEEQIQNESPAKAVKRFFLKKLPFLILVLLMAGFLYLVSTGEPQNGSAFLSWNQNTESDLAGYKIYYGVAPRTGDCPPGGYLGKADIGNNTSHTIGGLNAGATYYFSVISYDASGNESCFSPEVSKTITKENIFKKVGNKIINLFRL